ncbi:MAG: bifunctional diguanylate cyclase/phosphodiesterase [Bacillota bacterium]
MIQRRRAFLWSLSFLYILTLFLWIFISDEVLAQHHDLLKEIPLVLLLGIGFYLTSRWLINRLGAAEAELRCFVERIPVPVIAIDHEGRIVSWNPAATQVFGWTAEEVTGEYNPLVPTDRRSYYEESLSKVLDGEVLIGHPVKARRKDGSWVDVAVYTTPVFGRESGSPRFYAVLPDVTEERRSRAVLERYRALVENTREIVLFVRQADGRIIDANNAALKAYGYTLEQITQLTIMELRAPETLPILEPQLARAGREGIAFETLHRRRNGRSFPVEVYSTGVESEGGRVLMSLIRDITSHRMREETNRLLTEVDHRILQNEPLEVVLSSLVQGIAKLYRSDLVWIGSKKPTGEIEVQAATGVGIELLTGDCLRWDLPDEMSCPSALTLRRGTVQSGRIGDLKGINPAWLEIAQGYSLQSYLSIPLMSRGEVIGVMTMLDRHPDSFDPQRVADLQLFASQVALSILTAESQSRIRLQTIALQAADNAVVITDRTGTIQWVNDAFSRITGYSREEAVGQTPRILKSNRHADAFYAAMWQTIRAGRVWRGEIQNRRKDGSIYFEEMTVTPVRDLAGEITHFIAIKQDTSDRKRQEEQISYLARRDALTGLPNRHSFEEALAVAVLRAKEGKVSTLMLVDVDHLTLVNGVYGYTVGDHLLTAVAQRLRSLIRPGDMAARLGADEFGILVDGIGESDARALAEEIRQAVAELKVRPGEHLLETSVSMGVVSVDGLLGWQELLAVASRTLDEAREQGCNRVLFCSTTGDGGAVTENARMVVHVKEALNSGLFHLYYQPVVRLTTGQTDHFEALLRMRGPDGSLLTPAAFLPAAEYYGLMPQIDRWVLGTVVGELRRRPELRCFVNLSGQTLVDDQALTYMETLLREAGQGICSRLCLEVTERSAVHDVIQAQQWMNRLIELGCRFALDDFGMGFSSLAYLRALPTHFVKIDGSFVRNLQEDPANRAMVQAICAISHTFGKMVVAEWVEDPSTATTLQELGVEYGQGYGLGRPLPTLPDQAQ